MPLKYEDFLPYFKEIEGNIVFTENKTITADRVLLWDDTELIGDVTIYINNAKIVNRNITTKKRTRERCVSMYGKSRKTIQAQVLVLEGYAIPPSVNKSIAHSRTMNIPNGYDFTVKNNTRAVESATETLCNTLKGTALQLGSVYGTLNDSNGDDMADMGARLLGVSCEVDRALPVEWVPIPENFGSQGLVAIKSVRLSEMEYHNDILNGKMKFPYLAKREIFGRQVTGMMGIFKGFIYGDYRNGLVIFYEEGNGGHVYCIGTISEYRGGDFEANDMESYLISVNIISKGVLTSEYIESIMVSEVKRIKDSYIYIFEDGANVLGGTMYGTKPLLDVNNIDSGIVVYKFVTGNLSIEPTSNKYFSISNQNISQPAKLSYKNLCYLNYVNIGFYSSGTKYENNIEHFTFGGIILDTSDVADTLHFGKYFYTEVNKKLDFTGDFIELDFPGDLYTLSSTGFTIQYAKLKAYLTSVKLDSGEVRDIPTFEILGNFRINDFIRSDVDINYKIMYDTVGDNFTISFDTPRRFTIGGSGKNYIENVKEVRFNKPLFGITEMWADIVVVGGSGKLYNGNEKNYLTVSVSNNEEVIYKFNGAHFYGGDVWYDKGIITNDNGTYINALNNTIYINYNGKTLQNTRISPIITYSMTFKHITSERIYYSI